MFAARRASMVGGARTRPVITGYVSNTSSTTLPAHNVGDLIIFVAVNSSSTATSTSITQPAGWTSIISEDTARPDIRAGYMIATATDHTSGSWTNMNVGFSVVITGHSAASPIGGSAAWYSYTATKSLTVPAVSLSRSDGSSLLLQGGVMDITGASVPAGYVATNTNRLWTKDDTTSAGELVLSDLTNSQHRSSVRIEILAA